MKDESGKVKKVIYSRPKPNNFEQADRLVVIGELRNDVFYADEMLMKCPSKYNATDVDSYGTQAMAAGFKDANYGRNYWKVANKRLVY